MNETPKSFWKKSWPARQCLYPWLLTVGATGLIVLCIHIPVRLMDWLLAFFFSVVFATVIFAAWAGLVWLFRGRWLLFVASLVTLVALFYTEEDWRGWHAWHQFKHQWEAKGEHFEPAAIIPPPVPDDQNFAMTPIVFSCYGDKLTRDGKLISDQERPSGFVSRMNMPVAHENEDRPFWGDRFNTKFTDLAGLQAYYRQLSARTNEFPVPARPGTPAADVLLALGKYNSQIEELRAAAQLPESRFPVNYASELPFIWTLPHLRSLRSCAAVLQVRSAAELQNGQPELALNDLRLQWQLADKIRNEPILLSHLVRMAMMQMSLQSVWEGLAAHQWSDMQLAALDAELARFDFPADYQFSMRGETADECGCIDYLRRHPSEFFSMTWGDDGTTFTSPHHPPLLITLVSHLPPSGWYYQNQYYCARIMMNYFIPAANVKLGTFSPTLAREGSAALNAENKRPSPCNLLGRMLLPALVDVSRRFAYAQSQINLARAAVALERYRLANGDYPESLAPLVPRFVAQVPHDVIGGQPLKYRREADGLFVLYSIGWNETDDGGVIVFHKGSSPRAEFDKGDWVWKYPQPPASAQ